MAHKTTDPHPVLGVRTTSLSLVGGSVRALRSRVSVAALRGPVIAGSSNERLSTEAGGPPSPADGPEAPGGRAAASPSRPAIHGCDHQIPSASSVVIVPRHPADALWVAPGAREAEVDLPAEVRRRQAEVGLLEDQGRARQARHPRLRDDDSQVAAGERTGAGAPARRSELGRVSQVAGPGNPGLRLLHRGDGPASSDVRAVRDPVGLQNSAPRLSGGSR